MKKTLLALVLTVTVLNVAHSQNYFPTSGVAYVGTGANNYFQAGSPGSYLNLGNTYYGNSPYLSFNANLTTSSITSSLNMFSPVYSAGSGLVVMGEAGGSGLHFLQKSYSGSSSAVNLNNFLEVFTIAAASTSGLGGQVGVGTTAGYNFGTCKFVVEGKIGAREVIVSLTNPIADYVFAKNYKLRSLDSLQAFIEKNKHLPNIPSAQDVKEAGNKIELGAMNNKLLEKVEELTLYLLQLKKDNDLLKEKYENIENQLANLKATK